ncbi:MAG: glyoxalase [Chloroflexi bacterium RBG_16_72_14]|nr:MAG: glyoxalase [Chloroflexi bacterium RBG_16_72_14]
MEPRITLVTLGVVDLEHALRFYRDGLGWVPSPASVAGDVAFFQAGGLVVALWSREALADDARLPRDDGWGAVALAHNVASREAVDAVVAEMVAAGGRLLKAPAATDWGGHSGYVADPDGQPWEIAHNPFWPLQADGTVRLPS